MYQRCYNTLKTFLHFLGLFHFRCKDLDKKGILYVGSGVSGGEEGARYGPSLMPGGNAAAWPYIKDIFQVNDEIISMIHPKPISPPKQE